ncbi:MAG: adenylate/guanylate cyclase domain-containing protein [Micavibrio aeruginosavorus]|nr:adenylate/guanylate cyclase domain-containing protein [Micavibrio aeruginosavorus]
MGVIGLLIILLSPFFGAVVLVGLTLALVAGIGYASWDIFLRYGLLLDPVFPSLTIVVLFVLAALLDYIRTESERKHVRDAFSHYISPDFMKELTEDPDKLKLGGEVRDLTVMFTDIRGFTSISEKLSPEALIQLMNDFLTPMSALVMENRGTIDKYMGDAMMAFWNAPLDDENHARHACLTALKMNVALTPINDRLKTEGLPIVLAAGIGINTGPASVGNMGSKQRFAYSALGDTVNLASRLEGQTKAYGVTNLIGEETARKVADMALLELDLLRVKGKTEPARIYTLIGDDAVAASDQFASWRTLHEKMIAAYRAMDFDGAENLIAECRKVSGGALDNFYTIFAERIEALKTNRPGLDGWDGVYEATSK